MMLKTFSYAIKVVQCQWKKSVDRQIDYVENKPHLVIVYVRILINLSTF